MECTVSFVSCRCAPCGPRSGHVSVRGGPVTPRGRRASTADAGKPPERCHESSRGVPGRPLDARFSDASGRVPGRHFAQVSLVLVFYLCFSVLAWSACCWSALGPSPPSGLLLFPSPPPLSPTHAFSVPVLIPLLRSCSPPYSSLPPISSSASLSPPTAASSPPSPSPLAHFPLPAARLHANRWRAPRRAGTESAPLPATRPPRTYARAHGGELG